MQRILKTGIIELPKQLGICVRLNSKNLHKSTCYATGVFAYLIFKVNRRCCLYAHDYEMQSVKDIYEA